MTQGDEKRLPKFLNFDIEMIQDQMAAIAAQLATKDKKTTASQESDDFLPELNDEFNEGTITKHIIMSRGLAY